MALDNKTTVRIDGAKIMLRNFAGKEGPKNAPGERNFCVLIENLELAEELERDGWPVRPAKEFEDGEIRAPFIAVKLGYKGRPPHVVMLSSNGRTEVDEEMIDMFDWLEFENIDLIFRPYFWDVNGKSGIKAYLKTMYATVVEDDLDLKYAHVKDADEKQYGPGNPPGEED